MALEFSSQPIWCWSSTTTIHSPTTWCNTWGKCRWNCRSIATTGITIEQIRALAPERILISPGPCSPRESGLSNEIIRTFGPRVPTFGVCLGHQCIGHVFGGNVIVNYRMMHGKTSLIKHNGKDLFAGMPNPFAATRYHSLVIEREQRARLPGSHRRDRGG